MKIDTRHRLRWAAVLIFCSTLVLFFYFSHKDDSISGIARTPADRGRKVYIQEGCIHCHSQYIRPQGKDNEMWGPIHPPEDILAEVPPLIGNRRQGPDLLNVGLRRNSEWLRIHLADPRSLHSDSVMPSYAYLFNDNQGDDLVAYLSSLGTARDFREQRIHLIRNWKPNPQEPEIPMSEAEKRFQKSCLPCHGPQGLGDGPLAHNFKSPPRDLVHEPFLMIKERSEDENDDWARIIKFGILGTGMPGHEYLTDGEIKGLVRHVQSFRKVITPDQPLNVFLRSCAPCHGSSGQGDGPIGARLNPRPRDLRHEPFQSLQETAPDFEENLAKLIRDGLPNTAMPGNPSLSELDIQELIFFIKSIRRKSS